MMAYSRRREMAGLAVEPALAPGWGLSWWLRCAGRPDCARVNLRSQATNSWPLWSPASSEDVTGQKPHWPGSRSCLQRSFMTSTLRIASGRGSVRQWLLGAIALSPSELVSRIAKSFLS